MLFSSIEHETNSLFVRLRFLLTGEFATPKEHMSVFLYSLMGSGAEIYEETYCGCVEQG